MFQVQESKSRQTAWLNLMDTITFVPAAESTIQMVLSSLFYLLVKVQK